MKLLGTYQNGNYTVKIYDNGTKIRENDLDFFEPDTVESMDIKITNSCDKMCPFCHEASTPDGKHGDILNLPFLDTLHPYTELAIGGGNPLSHPDLIPFLRGFILSFILLYTSRPAPQSLHTARYTLSCNPPAVPVFLRTA